MKKTIALILAATLTFSGALATTTPVFAEQQPVRIVLDGRTLTVPSDMPQPQIINDRTMLPLRYTATVLGFDVSFDTETATATMTKGNIILRHKMFTNAVTVNGVERQYEVASQNQKDYIIVPLIMFLDATGTEGHWDGVTRTVTIDTEVLPHVLSMAIPDAPPIIRVGGSVTVAINASKTATNVQLFENNTTVVAQSSTFITNSDGTRTFLMAWNPENSGVTNSRTLKAVASSADGVSSRADTKEMSILVEGLPLVTPEITGMSLQDTVITAGSNARLTLYTTDAVERVRLTNNQNGNVEEVTQYTTTSKERRFEVSTRLLRTGSVRLTAEIAGEDGIFTDAHTTNVTVRNLSPYADDEVQVIQVSTSPRRARPDSNVIVSVITTNAVNTLSIIDDATNELLATKNSPDTSSALDNEKMWTFTIRIPSDSDGKVLNYFASAINGSQVRDLRFSIFADKDAGNPSLRIIDIDHDLSGFVGDPMPITVYTSASANRIEIYDNPDRRGHALVRSSSYAISSNARLWEVDLPIQKTGRHYYYVFAFDTNDNETQESFFLTGDSHNSFRGNTSNVITNVSVDDYNEDFDYNDRVYAAISTNNQVTEVWIEDPSGEKVASSTQFSGSNTRRWNLSFRANYARKDGYVKYYVYALADGREDAESFEIYVRY